jgi:hypothetical protein
MYDEALRSAYDYCFNNCPEGIDFTDIDTLNLQELGSLRNKCAGCKSSSKGIYKLDAILTAHKGQTKAVSLKGVIEAKEKELERSKEAITGLLELMHKTSKKEQEAKAKWFKVGRGATYFKRYSESIKNLQAEGKTQKQMAEILGISIGSVNKICKELKNSSMDAK